MDNWWKAFSEILKYVTAEELYHLIGFLETAFKSSNVFVWY